MLKWAQALREPGRRQVTWSPQTDFGQCCLGVACEVAMANGAAVTRTRTDPKGTSPYSYNGNFSDLPLAVQTWLGVDTDDPCLPVGRVAINMDTATVLNDFKKLTFADIAEAIELRVAAELDGT